MPHLVSISSQDVVLRRRMGRRVLKSLLIVGVLVSAGAANGQSASPTQQKPKAVALPAAKQPGGAAPATNAAASGPAAAPRALREAMAEMLEASTAYRTGIDGGAPKLSDVKFAGPILGRTSLFSSSETLLRFRENCVLADSCRANRFVEGRDR